MNVANKLSHEVASGRPSPSAVPASLAAILAGASALMLVWQTIDPAPVRIAGLTIDRLSALLTLLVALVGSVTLKFSGRYLDGHPDHPRFIRLLFATTCCAYLLMLSTNVVLLFCAWSLTSIGLHKLLTFCDDRKEAVPPARKKFLISRLGDVALLLAIAIAWGEWHALDLHLLISRAAETNFSGGATQAVALLITLAALTKSAQFPFHSWLPETMEAPTPVSALMHAGIINAGGVLLLRFAPIIVASPAALLLLSIVGTLTACLGMLAMWAQTNVKRTLAWSTVSQMGFMMVQCGLAVFPAAALHIVGHGCYKAWSFLRSGELPSSKRGTPIRPEKAIPLSIIGMVAAALAFAGFSSITGFQPWHSPGESAMAAVLALGLGQMWVTLFQGRQWLPATVTALLSTAFTVCVAGWVYRGLGIYFGPVFGLAQLPTTQLGWITAAIPVVSLLLLAVVHAMLPLLSRSATGRALRVHAIHGFYLGAVADRIVDRIWPAPIRKDFSHA